MTFLMTTKADLGLPSASEASTYQQNREDSEIIQLQQRITELEERHRILLKENENLMAKALKLTEGT